MIQQKKREIQTLKTSKNEFQKFNFLLTIITIILSFQLSFHAKGQNCSIRLQVETRPSTCQANGEIHCILSDTSGAQLEQIRYSYIPEDGTDAIINTELPAATHLRPGRYKVIVRALCATQLSQSDAFTIIADSIEQVIIEQQYNVPISGIPYHLFTFSTPYGIVPSYECTPTGQVQVNIENGTYPYSIEIWQDDGHGEHFIKTVRFSDMQHTGDDPQKFDYKNFYTIDSMSAGNYILYCYDGCGYHMPSLSVTVPEVVQQPIAQQHLLRNSSGIYESNNIIAFKEVLEPIVGLTGNDDYYRYRNQCESMYEYRFINPTWNGVPDTTQWYPLPTHEGIYVFIYDTLSSMSNYGEIWFRNIILQTRPIQCKNSIFSFDYDIYPQTENDHSILSAGRTTNVTEQYYDYCGLHETDRRIDFHIISHRFNNIILNCNRIDSIGCHAPSAYSFSHSIPNFTEGSRMHHYITLPLQCKITNTSADTIIGILHPNNLEYVWNLSWRAEPELHGDSVSIEISDANGCPLFSTGFKYVYLTSQQFLYGSYKEYDWESWIVPDKFYCPGTTHQIGLRQNNGYLTSMNVFGERIFSYSLDTIRIIESPENRYNCMIVSDTAQHFTVAKEHPEVSYTVDYTSSPNPSNSTPEPCLLLTADGLPNGRYVWEITWPCDRKRDTIIQDIHFQRIPDFETPPAFTFSPECTHLNIIPTAGQFNYGGSTLNTYFDLRRDGALEHSYNAVGIGDTLSAGLIGEYTLSMYSLPEEDVQLLSQNPCYVWDTVIVWNGNPFAFDYLYAYVCNGHDRSGNIITRGKQGKEPYTYTIFDRANGMGNVVAQNNTGDFYSQPCHLGQEMSIEMTDACNSHFITNFTISNMEQIRKGWVEDNQYEIVMHVGDTCHLYGISLGEVTYHWTGPNGFDESNQNCVFPITSELQSGKYRIEVLGSGCGVLLDSIVIRVDAHPCPEAIDFEGHHYPSIRINGLCWTQRNLQSHYYSDGEVLQEIYIYESTDFPNTYQNQVIYGNLYTWQQAVGDGMENAYGHTQGICPEGWYLPSREQYEQLATWGAAALRSPYYWINNSGGTNETGFSALPAGFFNGETKRYENMLGETHFWAVDARTNSENGSVYTFLYPCNEVVNDLSDSQNAYSIRCILEE